MKPQMFEPIYDPATINFRDAIGYLVGTVRQRLVEAADQGLAPLELTYAQAKIVTALANHVLTTPVEFCRALDYDPAAMTRLLDRLEKKGLIRRMANPDDRRSVDIQLTEQGKELYPRLVPVLVDAYNNVLRGVSKEEVHQLEALLRKILASP